MRNSRAPRDTRPCSPGPPSPQDPRSGTLERPLTIADRRALERVLAQRCAHLPARPPGRRYSLGEELFLRLNIGGQG